MSYGGISTHDASVVVDTHVKRISKRLGLTVNEDPEKDRAGSDEGAAEGSLDFV